MARTILTISLIVILSTLAGCTAPDSGRSQLGPGKVLESASLALIQVPSAAEVDLVEQLINYRQTYRAGIEKLIEYYTQTGNNMKLTWAKDELLAMDSMACYNYILQASLAGPELKADQTIPKANDLYYEAVALHEKAEALIVYKDEKLLRQALDKYNQLISEYPTSDKIDDAAFKAGRIYEHFQDYTIAVLYYKRTFQWNPQTITTAKYRAAFLLDFKLNNKDQALELYKQVLKEGSLQDTRKEFVQERISLLTKSDRSEVK